MTTPTLFQDLYSSFAVHPDTGQLLFKKNEQAIGQAIRNLVMTNHLEVPFQPSLGGNITRLLFAPMSPQIESELVQSIRQVISEYEPRATVTDVTVAADEIAQAYRVVVEYFCDFSVVRNQVQFTLTRVR